MSLFTKLDLDYAQAEKELDELRTFMTANPTFLESKIAPELKKRPHACCLIGSIIAGSPKPDLFKFEVPLIGTFRADLVIGNSKSGRFVFVEFEGGETNSLFGPGGTSQMRNWSKQFEHGFGQLVDWAWTINNAKGLPHLENEFGCKIAGTVSVLVCGCDAQMNTTERDRFEYRRGKTSIEGAIVSILTYDGLMDFWQSQIEAIKSYGKS